ncbi:hypothetical protein BDV34DRAFT_24175 [Aspergillus parasiticus]|uniref:Uncharacterized protein n=1 Tax=Aspergillus parasiticus TaxID=5067 RepID=A0A5N6DWU3_ASPPA|nr:hypothetical protein BDV34DRAFT_24175 [Aspergillus parasiticus]
MIGPETRPDSSWQLSLPFLPFNGRASIPTVSTFLVPFLFYYYFLIFLLLTGHGNDDCHRSRPSLDADDPAGVISVVLHRANHLCCILN